MIENRIYTIRDLKDWLIQNKNNGLSDYSVAPTRAYAIINNPCAKEDDPAVVVAFENQRPIGYSAVFSDEYVSGNMLGRFYWGTTEWIEPEYRGKGIAGKMMRALKEAVGVERYIGLESSIASVKLDQKQGASIIYYDKLKYLFASHSSIKGRLIQYYYMWQNKRVLNRLQKYTFQNQYVNYVDESTYQFIKEHATKDVFLRQRKMLNWILHYPFLIGTHADPKAKKDICEFGSTMDEYSIEAIKVYVADELVGFYIVSQTNNERTLRYLYYNEQQQDEVFASVTLNLLKPGVEKIHFMSSELQAFMHQYGIKHLNRKSYIDKIALTLPPGMTIDANLHIQGGDGDMFC